MSFLLTFATIAAGSLAAQPQSLTLKEALEAALRSNPDLILARIEEQKAVLDIRVAKDPFRPKVFAGSGLAYSSGFPMSIEGAAPSIVQARAVAALFNRPASYRVASAQEASRSAAIDTHAKRDEIALRTAVAFLEAARWGRTAQAIRAQIESLQNTHATVQARVREGRDLEIEAKRSALLVAKTQHRLDSAEQQRASAEASLGAILGLFAAERVRPVSTDPMRLGLAATEEECVRLALDQNNELRKLESAIQAKRHELKLHKAASLPQVDLVAQYGLFAKFNNYDDFFRRFQRHNGQFGISVQIPLFPSQASSAQGAQAQADLEALRTRAVQARSRITHEIQNNFRQINLLERSRELARTELELEREQVTILSAQLDEGRASFRQVEEARFVEQEKWALYYESQLVVERARLDLLYNTGKLLSTLL
ncbi:MAG: TolC family protein [Candidatus Solibacter usitatus]|nr:TolC family protein [Candidatus Solibacter usitatus]